MENNEIIYAENSSGEILESHLEEYLGKSGVWALYGTSRKTAEERCLNVGKHVDVGTEILYDIGCMHYLRIREDGDTKYINQFRQDCGFFYKKGQTVEYLYPIIVKEYHSIKFVLIANESGRDVESDYAHKEHAVYWRNGGAFKDNTESKSLKQYAKLRIGELFPNGGEVYTIDELTDVLCMEFGYEKIWAMRILNEMVKDNHIIQCNDNSYTR